MERTKIWVNKINFSSALEFLKLCLKVKAKSITLSDMDLHVCRENI